MLQPTITEALAHLQALRARYSHGDVVDLDSGLTADDLDSIVAACTTAPEDQIIDQLGDMA